MPRPLARIRGRLDDLLADPALDVHETAWVEATLTDVPRPAHAMDRLRRRFPHTLLLGFEATHSPLGAPAAGLHRPLDDRDIAHEFITELRGTPATPDERALLDRAVDSCCHDDTDTLVRAT